MPQPLPWFVAGPLIGLMVPVLLAAWLAPPVVVQLSPRAVADLQAIGIHDFTGLAPREIFSWSALTTVRGLISMVAGGFLVGFGTAYAGGCTSGHAIAGLADRQLPSLVAVCGFFAGGLAATYLLLPVLLR